MNKKLVILSLLLLFLISLQINAQMFGGSEGGGQMGGGFMGRGHGHRFGRFRQMLMQNLTPQQQVEVRQIWMANRGNRPAMRAQMDQWAARQGPQVQAMFQRFRQMRQQWRMQRMQGMGGMQGSQQF